MIDGWQFGAPIVSEFKRVVIGRQNGGRGCKRWKKRNGKDHRAKKERGMAGI